VGNGPTTIGERLQDPGSEDPSAYHYLYESVMRFPEGADFCRRLFDAGFENVEEQRLSFGIATIYLAQKP